MNKKLGYWIIGAAFFVQVLFVPWEIHDPLQRLFGSGGWRFHGYLPLFTDSQDLRLDSQRLVIQLIITALVAVGYAYMTREKGEG